MRSGPIAHKILRCGSLKKIGDKKKSLRTISLNKVSSWLAMNFCNFSICKQTMIISEVSLPDEKMA
jgi:hypothetical protein